MKLSELKTGERGVIVRVSGHGSFRKRIIEMGFVKGIKDHLHLIALHKAHLDYPLAETAVTGYSHDHATLASLQF